MDGFLRLALDSFIFMMLFYATSVWSSIFARSSSAMEISVHALSRCNALARRDSWSVFQDRSPPRRDQKDV